MPERQIIDYDVVVPGASAAGMMAARAAAEAIDSRKRSVCCVSKMPPATPNCTTRAYGDITWALSEHEDELVRQIHETGGWLGELDAIRGLARRVPTVLDRLRLLGAELDAHGPPPRECPASSAGPIVAWTPDSLCRIASATGRSSARRPVATTGASTIPSPTMPHSSAKP